ncbi:Ulp1 family isopeptidase [Xylophilus ampelinus]|nr:Ulp1 family isopeptidase [Xylophilus ampelinus]
MDDFSKFDIDKYRRLAEPTNNPGDPHPSTERSERSARFFPLQLSMEGLPPRRESPGRTDGAADTMHPHAPVSILKKRYAYEYKKLIEIIPRYGRGESLASLRKIFPEVGTFLTGDGRICEKKQVVNLIRSLKEKEIDYIAYHVAERIARNPDDKYRKLMRQALEVIIGREVELKPKQPEDIVVDTSSEKKDMIDGVLKILPRYAKGESMTSLRKDFPNITTYLLNSRRSDANGAKCLLSQFTTEQRREFDRAVESRAKKISSWRTIKSYFQNNPKEFMEISKNFSDRSLDIQEICEIGSIPKASFFKMVDQDNGNLRRLGKEVIEGFNESLQAAIRANFKLRFQETPVPADRPHRSVQQAGSLPYESLVSGVDAHAKSMGYATQPATPQYPARSHDSIFGGLSSLNEGVYREYDIDTPGEVEQPWRTATPVAHETEPATPQYPARSHDSIFGGLSSLNEGVYREYDLNTPGEVEQPWRTATPVAHETEPATPQYPARSHDSIFGGLSSLNEGVYREYDIDTPGEVEQPWRTATPVATPERIVVDDLPSPQIAESTGLGGLTAHSYLGDEHLFAYTNALALQLDGRPNAELLNFADPAQVALLVSEDRRQRRDVLRRLAGSGTPPIVFLPINDTNRHWSLLVIDRRTNQAFHYDSLVQPGHAQHATGTYQYALARKAATAMGIDGPVSGMPIAQQRDGHSCGDHVLHGIEVLAHRVVDGTFQEPGGLDLSDIQPDRGRIADVVAGTGQFRADSGAEERAESTVTENKRRRLGRF